MTDPTDIHMPTERYDSKLQGLSGGFPKPQLTDVLSTQRFKDTRRRERLEVAARIMAGMVSNPSRSTVSNPTADDMAVISLRLTDALIARIDASPSDKEPRP